MTEAYQWSTEIKPKKGAEQRIKTRQGQEPEVKLFYITPSGRPTIKEIDIDNFKRQQQYQCWKKFKTYTNYQSKLWLVSMKGDDWKDAWCTSFLKKNICKHIVGIAILKGFCDVPVEAKCIPIGAKPKRGRPSKAKKAFIVQ